MGIIVIAHYKPNDGSKDAFIELIREHQVALRDEGLITARDIIEMEAADGTLLELFEWKSEEASRSAHTNDQIQSIWARMGEIGSFPMAKDVAEYNSPFAHFMPKEY
jgi:quinol monooxygenase YgiN